MRLQNDENNDMQKYRIKNQFSVESSREKWTFFHFYFLRLGRTKESTKGGLNKAKRVEYYP
jgi:hypothetical protein